MWKNLPNRSTAHLRMWEAGRGNAAPGPQISEDDCARNNPCQNGGECVQRAGTTACNCPLGFGGNYCQQGTSRSQSVCRLFNVIDSDRMMRIE